MRTPYVDDDRIEIYPDVAWTSSGSPWDDFGYQTTFQAALFFNEKKYELPQIKILIKNQKSTHKYFQHLLQEAQENYLSFPLNNTKYISLPTDTEFYTILHSLLLKTDIVEILTSLHDASYMKNTLNLQKFEFMMKTEGFYGSLSRDMTSKRALDYGWLIVDNRTLEKELYFELTFKLNTYKNEHKVPINFKPSIFPNNINILIGSNGSGKSQTLKYLIDELLGIGTAQQVKRTPIFNQIVAIAYSPFENYRTSLKDTTLTVKTVYKYFGFRNENGVFNHKRPFANSINAIFRMLREDKEKDYFSNRHNKYDMFKKVIATAVEYDEIGFKLNRETLLRPDRNKIVDNKYYMIIEKDDFLNEIHVYDEYIDLERGIVFFKDEKVMELSSGQQIFAQLVSSIIGSIREDTILLIDEPELYLHPNMEIELIEMLKAILRSYKSYAIIATHSNVFAREVARDYIAVLKRVNNTIQISKPPFETFGGDIERINSYVFFDKDIEKPFEKWLQKLVNDAGGAKEAIEQYQNELNEESIILMYGMKVENA